MPSAGSVLLDDQDIRTPRRMRVRGSASPTCRKGARYSPA